MCLFASPLAAQDSGVIPPPTDREVTAVFVEEGPRVDGRLDDAVWEGVEPITQFLQNWPDDGEPSTEPTEVRIVYDRNNLYFGFRFYDSEPSLIRAKNLERGGRNDRDDHAYIGLDTYMDRRNAYLFEMNALGTQDARNGLQTKALPWTVFPGTRYSGRKPRSTSWGGQWRYPFLSDSFDFLKATNWNSV